MEAKRIIGIRHRVKQRKDGDKIIKSRPTQVAILANGHIAASYNLEDERAELDWVWGKFPVEYRRAIPGEDLSVFKAHHIRWRKTRKGESIDHSVAEKVPAKYDGLRTGDIVSMVLGGSGNRFAAALARRGSEIQAEVWRIPPYGLKARRDGKKKDDDSIILANLARDEIGLFQKADIRDIGHIILRERYIARVDAMKERIACEQRLWQRMNGALFLSEEGKYPEGKVEDLFDEMKASDAILQSLLDEEKARERELSKAIKSLNSYQEVFRPIEGMGPMIAARIMVAIGDIRRFPTASKLKAYCSMFVLFEKGDNGKKSYRKLMPGERPEGTGRFVRRRTGELANWSNDARQALYLLGDQFNRRPDSVWGKKLLEYKAKLRAKHPEILCQECGIPFEACDKQKSHKTVYSNAHIHKMALWRTLTKYVEWLWREWTRLETSR